MKKIEKCAVRLIWKRPFSEMTPEQRAEEQAASPTKSWVK